MRFYYMYCINDHYLPYYIAIDFGRELVQDARAQHRHHTPQLETRKSARVDHRLHSEQAQVAC